MCNLKAPKLGTGHHWDFQLKRYMYKLALFSLQKSTKKRDKAKKKVGQQCF